ncbi:hypothetical protein NP233_g3797 [Leucocoprinus birnbaumii]|uniref:Uncharacterized protein n=1 Tax=Leucocoprinus birnbaumii TaxID=56174 RepID=A0AAD5VWK0_9AGAR|nr:hypothetical protein NP233_g3797 [Leucocoprinus birnbaumii]
MLQNFLHLVNAIKIGSMRTTSLKHSQDYEFHMKKYLETLLELYPGATLSPYQHMALHVGQQLRRFGPTHAWRCFAFERYNHLFQNIDTNNIYVHSVISKFNKAFKSSLEGTVVSEQLKENLNDNSPITGSFSERVCNLLTARFKSEKQNVSNLPIPQFYGRINKYGYSFALSSTSIKDSRIMFTKKPKSGIWSLGSIIQIFSFSSGEGLPGDQTFFCVEEFADITEAEFVLVRGVTRDFPEILGRFFSLQKKTTALVRLDEILGQVCLAQTDYGDSVVQAIPMNKVSPHSCWSPSPYAEADIDDIGAHLRGAPIGSAALCTSKEEEPVPLASPCEEHSLTNGAQTPSAFSSSLSSIGESEHNEVPQSSPQQEDQSVYEKGSLRTIYGMGKRYRVFQSYSNKNRIDRPPAPRSGLTFLDASLYAHVYEDERSEKCAQLWVYSAQSRQWKPVTAGHVQELSKKLYQVQWTDGYGASWTKASRQVWSSEAEPLRSSLEIGARRIPLRVSRQRTRDSVETNPSDRFSMSKHLCLFLLHDATCSEAFCVLDANGDLMSQATPGFENSWVVPSREAHVCSIFCVALTHPDIETEVLFG